MRDTGYRTGPIDAPVTIVVFSDFECPFCRAFAPVTDSLRIRFPDVEVVERNFPLTNLHPHALNAALVGECAKRWGRYPAVRRELFSRLDLLEAERWDQVAAAAGIADTVAFGKCVGSERGLSAIERDVAVANSIGAHGTPSVVVNDTLLGTPPTYAELAARIRRIMDKAER